MSSIALSPLKADDVRRSIADSLSRMISTFTGVLKAKIDLKTLSALFNSIPLKSVRNNAYIPSTFYNWYCAVEYWDFNIFKSILFGKRWHLHPFHKSKTNDDFDQFRHLIQQEIITMFKSNLFEASGKGSSYGGDQFNSKFDFFLECYKVYYGTLSPKQRRLLSVDSFTKALSSHSVFNHKDYRNHRPSNFGNFLSKATSIDSKAIVGIITNFHTWLKSELISKVQYKSIWEKARAFIIDKGLIKPTISDPSITKPINGLRKSIILKDFYINFQLISKTSILTTPGFINHISDLGFDGHHGFSYYVKKASAISQKNYKMFSFPGENAVKAGNSPIAKGNKLDFLTRKHSYDWSDIDNGKLFISDSSNVGVPSFVKELMSLAQDHRVLSVKPNKRHSKLLELAQEYFPKELISTELGVYLIKGNHFTSGHIDILLLVNGILYVCDYKPHNKVVPTYNPDTNTIATGSILLDTIPQNVGYIRALSQEFGIDVKNIVGISFNKEGINENKSGKWGIIRWNI